MPSNCQVSHCPRANGDISETLVLSDQQRRPWKCLIYVNIKPDRGSKSSHLQSWSRPAFGIFCQTKNQLPRFVCPINYPRSRLIVLAPYVILPLSMCVVLVLTPSQGLLLHLLLMSPRPEYKAPRRYRGFFLPGCSLFFF